HLPPTIAAAARNPGAALARRLRALAATPPLPPRRAAAGAQKDGRGPLVPRRLCHRDRSAGSLAASLGADRPEPGALVALRTLTHLASSSRRCRPVRLTKTSSRLACRVVRPARLQPSS